MPETIENRMGVDWQWPEEQPEIQEKLNPPGYRELGTRNFVPDEDAFDYALECISQDENEKREFIDWFYSENWIKED